MVVPTGYLPKLGTFIPSCPSHRPHQFPLWSLMEACRHIWFWIQNPIYDLFPFVERAIHYQTTAQPTTHQKPDILLRPAYVHLPQKPSLIPLLVTLMVILHIQTVRAIALTGMAPGIVRDIQQKKHFFRSNTNTSSMCFIYVTEMAQLILHHSPQIWITLPKVDVTNKDLTLRT